MRILGEADLDAAVSTGELLEEVERALRLYATGGCRMPERMHVEAGDDTLLLMPCFGPDGFGTKLVSVFPGNRAHGEAVVQAVMVLNDPATGRPLAVLDGRALTALRTGAVGGVAVRHLAPPEARTLGVVGAGVQGLSQVRFIAAVRDLAEVIVWDHHPGNAGPWAERARRVAPGVTVRAAGAVEDLLEASDVVVTATTSAVPVLPEHEKLLVGKLFVGIGSYRPTMREFPEALFRRVGRVLVDTEHAIRESGDLREPLERGWLRREQVVPLGAALEAGEAAARAPGETVLFKSVGMALLDVCAGFRIYRNAVRNGLGVDVPL